MSDSKNPLRRPAVFFAVALGVVVVVAVGGYFLIGTILG